MKISLIGLRQFRSQLVVLTLLAILGMGAFEAGKILHEINEPDCLGKVTGNPAACIFCAHFLLLVSEAVPEFTVPDIVRTVGFVTDCDGEQLILWQPDSQQARAPPFSA